MEWQVPNWSNSSVDQCCRTSSPFSPFLRSEKKLGLESSTQTVPKSNSAQSLLCANCDVKQTMDFLIALFFELELRVMYCAKQVFVRLLMMGLFWVDEPSPFVVSGVADLAPALILDFPPLPISSPLVASNF